MCEPTTIMMGMAMAGTQIAGQQKAASETNKIGAELGAQYVGDTLGAQSSAIAQNFITAQNAARESFSLKQKKEHGLARINVSYADQYSLHSSARSALHNSAMDAEWASAQAGGIRVMKTQDQMDVNHRKLLAGLAGIPTSSRGEQFMGALSAGVSAGAWAYQTDIAMKAATA